MARMSIRKSHSRLAKIIARAELLSQDLAEHADEPDGQHMASAKHWIDASILTLKGAHHDIERHLKTTKTQETP